MNDGHYQNHANNQEPPMVRKLGLCWQFDTFGNMAHMHALESEIKKWVKRTAGKQEHAASPPN